MSQSNDEIDDLYRRPLDQFTAARNTLAKTRGAEGASIKALEKPNVAAWGVNQLYWHGREHYDRLVKASEESREAHRNVLAGRPADVRLTEKAHREAIREAAEKIRELLASGGQATTAQTMTAVAETLEALPTDDPPGRLTRPLKPLGFAALSGVPVRATSAEKPQRATMKLVETKADPAAEQRNEERARRQAEEGREQLRAAQKEAREAEVTEQRARAAVEKAEREVERRTTALDEATETLRRLQKELKDATVAYQRARLRARL